MMGALCANTYEAEESKITTAAKGFIKDSRERSRVVLV
jgi:hypothetical protein